MKESIILALLCKYNRVKLHSKSYNTIFEGPHVARP
jgi:hypothetical protein